MTPAITELAEWIEKKIQTEKYGEIHITFKVHAGRPTLLEKCFVEKTQLDTVPDKRYHMRI